MGELPECGPAGRYEYTDHAADLGVTVEAPSLPDLFRTAATATMAWIGAPPESGPSVPERIEIEAGDLEELLVRWLQEMLFLFQHRHAFYVDAPEVEISGTRIEAAVLCRRWDESAAGNYQEVKAVTYHRLEVSRKGTGWGARFILDI